MSPFLTDALGEGEVDVPGEEEGDGLGLAVGAGQALTWQVLLQFLGHIPLLVPASQASPASTTPLPHTGEGDALGEGEAVQETAVKVLFSPPIILAPTWASIR